MSKLKFLTRISILSVIASLTLVACDRDDNKDCLINSVTIEIDPATAAINEGESLPLQLVFNPTNYPNKQALWKSSDPTIATVNPDGVVTGIKPGKTTIIATLTATKQTARTEVTIVPKDVIPEFTFTVEPSEIIILANGDPVRPEVIFNPEGLDQKYKHLLWSSSDKTIATVDEDGNIYGKKKGETVITIQSPVNETKATITLIVIEEAPEFTFTVDKEEVEIYAEGDPAAPVITFDPADLDQDYKMLLWTSDDKTIATVNPDGKIYGKKAGETFVYAKSPINNKEIKIKVKVLPKK